MLAELRYKIQQLTLHAVPLNVTIKKERALVVTARDQVTYSNESGGKGGWVSGQDVFPPTNHMMAGPEWWILGLNVLAVGAGPKAIHFFWAPSLLFIPGFHPSETSSQVPAISTEECVSVWAIQVEEN
ncbi:hypothetical protein Y1Q_0021107 [Alligator mississippiensis]|uniref:Uncharacterized protein n=1 Tax=Alligator mississippiensis TaxID=8496 RepID=A0A151NRQ3_ALLMI|nr:hypothetical protein Y1Q_0021107 [Alligator mississippiensis]